MSQITDRELYGTYRNQGKTTCRYDNGRCIIMHVCKIGNDVDTKEGSFGVKRGRVL